MRYNRVLLVSPRFYTGRNRLALLPLTGIGYIAEALKKIGVEVAVLDMNLGYSDQDLESKIRQFRPEIIGFTVMTLGYKYFYGLVDKIKKSFPEIKMIVGGAHISALREKVLNDCPGIDYAIMLEADISIVELCKDTDLAKIEGLIYRNRENQIISNPQSGFIEDLDSLSFPKYDGFELEKYPTRQLGIVTSRGCPYDCIYCSVIATSGKRFRVRSAISVVEEIEYWHKKGYRQIFILDDNFTLIRKRVEEVCRLLKEKNMEGLHIKCPNGIRADKVDREMLKSMKEVGFDFIAFGVEAGSNKVLKNLKKGEDIEIVEKGIKDACDLGFDVDLFFLIGSPGETMQDVEKSFSLAKRYPLRRAIFYNLIPLPATELLRWLESNHYLIYPLEDILNNSSYYKNRPCFFTPEMSIAQRKEALKTGQDTMVEIRRKFIERKIKGPFLLKRLFSKLYTHPVLDDFITNNRLVVQTKEKIKNYFTN